MTASGRGREQAVENALEAHTSSCERVENAAWKLVLTNGRDLHGAARVADGWLLLDSPLAAAAAGRDPWQLLRWNAELPGGAKFVLPREDSRPHLQAEVPLDDDIDLAARIRQACAGFGAASALLCGGAHADREGPFAHGSGAGLDLPRLCSEAGWPFVVRSSGALAVTLEVSEAFHQAIVETEAQETAVRVCVPLTADDGSRPAPCRAAVGSLALRASAAVRMARAAAVEVGSRTAIRFEVVLAGTPAASEIGHTLAALSVACRLCAREASVLERDEAVARHYLACGW